MLEYKGVNHEPGNIFVYAPRQKVLFFVDVIFPGWVPFKNCAMTEDVPGFLKAHEQVLGYDFDTLVAGHLTRLGTSEDVEVQRDYFRDVRAACEAALRSVNWMEVAGEVGWDNLWVVFDAYLDRVAETAAAEVTPRWLGRLAAADVFTQDHCWTIMESLRIDGGMVPGMSGTAEAGPQWAADRKATATSAARSARPPGAASAWTASDRDQDRAATPVQSSAHRDCCQSGAFTLAGRDGPRSAPSANLTPG